MIWQQNFSSGNKSFLLPLLMKSATFENQSLSDCEGSHQPLNILGVLRRPLFNVGKLCYEQYIGIDSMVIQKAGRWG